MPKGIQFDSAGVMTAIHITYDTVTAELNELIETLDVTPTIIKPGITLWTDSLGNQRVWGGINAGLTRVVRSVNPNAAAVYGTGVFLGNDDPTNPHAIASLSADNRLWVVLAGIDANTVISRDLAHI